MITNLFLKYFAQKDSAVIRYIASLIASGLVYLITKFVPPNIWSLTPEQELAIAGGVLLVVNNIITEIVTTVQAKNAAKIQDVINQASTGAVPTVNTDGRIGNYTLDAVKSLVAVANTAMPESAVPSEIKQQIAQEKRKIDV